MKRKNRASYIYNVEAHELIASSEMIEKVIVWKYCSVEINTLF